MISPKALLDFLRRTKGKHRRTCRCSKQPAAAYPGTKWTCPDCGQVYQAEIYRGHIVWLYCLAAPNYKIRERRDA